MPRFIHPLTQTALEPLYIDRHGRPHFPIMGGAPDGPPAGQAGQPQGQQQAGPPAGQPGQQSGQQQGADPGQQQQTDNGFPANTPVADMTDAQQAAYWKHQARKHEGRASERADYDTIKAERDRLQQASMTESDKALAAAREEGRAAERQESNRNTVTALLDGALRVRGRSDDQIAEQLKFVNPDAFVTDGTPDTKAIIAYAESLAGPGTGHSPDYGAGNRGRRQGATGRDAGLAEAQRRGYVKTQ